MENGRGDLPGFDLIGDHLGRERRIVNQERDVSVIVCEAAMFGKLAAAGVYETWGCDGDEVGRAVVPKGVSIERRKIALVEELGRPAWDSR